MDAHHANVLKWCERMNIYNEKINYYTEQLKTATQDQIPHFTAKKAYYIEKKRDAEDKYLKCVDLFVGDEYVKYMPQI
jgi:hypothetical protein